MEAIVRSIKETTHNKKSGGTFKTIDITCDVMVDSNTKDVRSLVYSRGSESVVKYMAFCKMTSDKLINSYVDVTTAKRMFTGQDGQQHTYTYIKYLNILDENGKSIIMKSESSENKLPF